MSRKAFNPPVTRDTHNIIPGWTMYLEVSCSEVVKCSTEGVGLELLNGCRPGGELVTAYNHPGVDRIWVFEPCVHF
jgi:hypothetical protein